jgi:hypothetical protein
MLSDSTHEETNQAVVRITNMPLEQGQPVSKLANELPTIVDDLGGSIERRFMADSVEKVVVDAECCVSWKTSSDRSESS